MAKRSKMIVLTAPLRVYRYSDEKTAQILSNTYVFKAASHLELKNPRLLKGSSGASSLVATSTIFVPFQALPYHIGLFRLTSVVLLYRNNFGLLKIWKMSVSFIFRHFFCPKFFASYINWQEGIDLLTTQNRGCSTTKRETFPFAPSVSTLSTLIRPEKFHIDDVTIQIPESWCLWLLVLWCSYAAERIWVVVKFE